MAESAPAAPGRIFISYRQEETAYAAGWLFDRLSDHFGQSKIFKDIDSIEPGDDFVDVITTAVGSCDVLLALIGSTWLTVTDAEGRRRLDNPDDFLRLEIEAALARKVRIIPVLVDGAKMPRADDLPPTLAPLVRRQALELSPSHFSSQISRLFNVLEQTLAEVQAVTDTASGLPAPARAAKPPSEQVRWLFRRKLILAGAGLGVVLVAVLIVALASSSQAAVFKDDFSSRTYAWDDAGGKPDGGHYTKGAYRIYSRWAKDHFSEQAFPHKATSVFPSAPRDVRVSVVARRLLGAAEDAGYGITCRADMTGESFYELAIWRDFVAIAKLTPTPPYFKALRRSEDMSAVHQNGKNRMQAVCTTDQAGAVRLVLSVNGEVVARAKDMNNPLSTGTVGLQVATGDNAKAIEAEFDDFVVTRA